MKRIALLAAATLLVLTGCLAAPGDEPEPIDYVQLAEDALAHLPGVKDLALTQQPVSSESTPDPAEPADWSITLTVMIKDDATADEVTGAAEAERAFSQENAVAGQWQAGVAFETLDRVPDDDLPAQDSTGFTVYPESVDAREFMQLVALPGVESASTPGTWPFVTVTSASDLHAVQQQLSGMSLWQEGGRLWAENGRVRLTELPESLTDSGYAAIIEASVLYPAAQFWLEAPTTGRGWPQLFVDQVSTEEAAAIQRTLTQPAVAASADVNFFIRAIGPDGAVDTAGVLGKR